MQYAIFTAYRISKLCFNLYHIFMNICTLGYHDPEGVRHWIIREGLEKSGHKVFECITDKKGLIPKYIDLTGKYWKQRKKTDAILVPFSGHYIMPLAWLLRLVSRKKIIFDVFISLHDTLVDDRKLVKPNSFYARFLRFMDWLSCRLASVILIDTELHKQFFVDHYKISPEKILVLPIGCRADLYEKTDLLKNDKFTVIFYGSYIPLQGIDVILKAASIIQKEDPSIQFELIGKGQTRSMMEGLAKQLELTNAKFINSLPLEELVKKIKKADICLGIFGTSEKANRVIPHKVYDALCAGCPLVTARTQAAKALMSDGKNAILSAPGDAEDLARQIIELKKDENLRNSIANGGRKLFNDNFTTQKIVAPLADWLNRLNS